jgi:hypothetical protein
MLLLQPTTGTEKDTFISEKKQLIGFVLLNMVSP